MTTQEMVDVLSGIKFLDGMKRSHIEKIAEIARLSEFDSEDVIFRNGQVAGSVYLVASGELLLELSPTTVYRKDLVRALPGDMLGWSAFVASPRYVASAVAVRPGQLVDIDGARLRALCEADHEFGYQFTQRVVRDLATRLMDTWHQLAHLYVSQYVPVTAPIDETDE